MVKSRKRAAGLTLATGLLIFSLSPPAAAHPFGNVGYSEIGIRERTIDYALLLDYEQLLAYLPIDGNGDGKADEKELAQKALIKEFITDHIAVSADGARGEPEVLNASEVKRNDSRMIRFELKYAFGEPVRSYEIDYRLYVNDFDTEHKNFATIRSGGAGRDKIFSRGDHVLKGTVDAQAGDGTQQTGTAAGYGVRIWTASLTAVAGLAAMLAWLMTAGRKRKEQPR